MKPEPRIETINEKKLIGIRTTMSLSSNKTGELWRSFMPRRKEITNTIGSKLFSMQLYNATYFDFFSADTEFEKWAAVEASDFDTIPQGMEAFTLPQACMRCFFIRAMLVMRLNFSGIFFKHGYQLLLIN